VNAALTAAMKTNAHVSMLEQNWNFFANEYSFFYLINLYGVSMQTLRSTLNVCRWSILRLRTYVV